MPAATIDVAQTTPATWHADWVVTFGPAAGPASDRAGVWRTGGSELAIRGLEGSEPAPLLLIEAAHQEVHLVVQLPRAVVVTGPAFGVSSHDASCS